MEHILSLGAGVQSSTMALMAALGEIKPMPMAAIFADTKAEPQSVYIWLDWLEKRLPFPVKRVSKGNLAIDSLRLAVSKKTGKVYSKGGIPVFMKKPDGSAGLMWRRCTSDYKIEQIQREEKRLLSLKRVPCDHPVVLTQWIGISIDEADRMKDARHSWIKNRWPLIEMKMTREMCLQWMQSHGFPMPPRSACRFCPYHSDAEWLRLKKEEPREFWLAVLWEKRYQAAVAKDEVTEGTPFLHRSLIPLSEVKFDPSKGAHDFSNECEGMCGV